MIVLTYTINMWKNTPKLYSVDQIRALEALATASFNITEAQLMQRAGVAAFHLLQNKFPQAKNIFVFCGKGNNGGDGYVLAHLAYLANLNVNIRCVGQLDDLTEVSRSNYLECKEARIDIKAFDESEKFEADVIVDALLGIGIKGEVKESFKSAIEIINNSDADVLSIDVASGLDADHGVILGTAVKADFTSTFIGYKKGLVTGEACAVSGTIHCDDLGIPAKAFNQVQTDIKLLIPEELNQNLLPPRPKDAHKGDFGHVLVIGGEHGMAGAARMAAEAAARTGAGLVSVATHPEHLDVITAARPELMCHGVESPKDLAPLLERATVIVIGPGLGTGKWGSALLDAALKTVHPKVIDADGLNLLAKNPRKSNNWVLTPHPGEAKRLIGKNIQSDRYKAASDIQKQYGGVCVLSGVIAAFIAQGVAIDRAAELGVLVHAVAADQAAYQGGEKGLLALDVVDAIRAVVNGLR